MGARTLVSVEEYLSTVYEPECDYVDGELVDRHGGEKTHSKVQARLVVLFSNQKADLGIHVFPELRIRVAPKRFRVPDVCVVLGEEPAEEVLTAPPFLCIEVLSPEDEPSRFQQKVADYLAFGVPNVWVIDPWERCAFLYTHSGMRQADEFLETQPPKLEIRLADLFD